MRFKGLGDAKVYGWGFRNEKGWVLSVPRWNSSAQNFMLYAHLLVMVLGFS